MDIEQRMNAMAAYVTSAHWHTVDLLYAASNNQPPLICPVCRAVWDHSPSRTYRTTCQFGGGVLERYQCQECDLVFGPKKMLDLTPEMLDADYRLLYETYRETNSTENETRAFRSLDPDPHGVFMNWGCGAWAETIGNLRGEGWDVWGYEPSVPSSSDFVVQHAGAISAKFDGIFSNNVIEHFRDPVAEFNRMASHLKPGGVMVHATACYELLYDNTRFHTAFYLGRSPKVLAQRVGLEVVAEERDGEYMSVTFQKVA